MIYISILSNLNNTFNVFFFQRIAFKDSIKDSDFVCSSKCQQQTKIGGKQSNQSNINHMYILLRPI